MTTKITLHVNPGEKPTLAMLMPAVAAYLHPLPLPTSDDLYVDPYCKIDFIAEHKHCLEMRATNHFFKLRCDIWYEAFHEVASILRHAVSLSDELFDDGSD